MRTGGDALNEATVLAKLGEEVRLLTVLGEDPAAEIIRGHCRKWGIGLEFARTEPGVDTGINVVLVKENGERCFLTNPHGTLRILFRGTSGGRFSSECENTQFCQYLCLSQAWQ